MLLNKRNVHLTQPTPALTPVYLASRQGVDTEDGSLASDHDYHIVICSVTRGLVQRPGRPWTPCVMLPTNPAPYTIVEWGIQTARYIWYKRRLYLHAYLYIIQIIFRHKLFRFKLIEILIIFRLSEIYIKSLA